jgi:hypothetical protein
MIKRYDGIGSITALAALRVKEVFVAWNGFGNQEERHGCAASLYEYWIPMVSDPRHRNVLTRFPQSDFGMQAGSGLALAK